MQVFVNGDNPDNVRELIKLLDEAMQSHKSSEFKAFILFTSGQSAQLEALARSAGTDRVALCLLKGPTDETLKQYKVNPAAKNTVLVYKRRHVTANFVDLQATRDGSQLKKAIADICR